MISSDAKKLQANWANWASENYDRVQCVKREHGTRRDDRVKFFLPELEYTAFNDVVDLWAPIRSLLCTCILNLAVNTYCDSYVLSQCIPPPHSGELLRSMSQYVQSNPHP